MKISHMETIINVDFDNIDELKGIDDKFHYFYKIVNNINNSFYYGIHSTKKINDGYSGSGTILKLAYQKYGKFNFTKYILTFFDDRKSLLEYEKFIVNNELLKEDKCYNLIEGGKESYNPENIKSEYILHTTLGLIHINNGHKSKLINPVQINEYIKNGWVVGQLHKSVKDKILIHNSNNEELFIYPEEFQKYEQSGWIRGGKSRNKGQKSFAKNCVWINNGDICKRVSKEELQQYLDNGWQRGSIQKYTNGYIRITDGQRDKNISPENKEELQQYLDNGWKLGTHIDQSNRVFIKKDNITKRIPKEELQQYLDNGWQRGSNYKPKITPKGRIYIYKENILKIISKEELQQYLDNGWQRGNPKNKRESHNKGKIRVNNGIETKTIYKEELQQYLDNGWQRGNVWKDNMRGRIRVNNSKEERFITKEEFKTYDKSVWRRGLIKWRRSK